MPTQKQRQLTTALLQFYQQPVAKVSMELLLSLGTVIFFALFAIRPTLLTMSDLLKQIDDKKELTSQLDKKIAALSSVQTEYLRLEPRLVVLDQTIPNSPQLLYSVKVIERLASDKQLLITGINVPEVPPEAPATTSPTSLTLAESQPKRVDLPVSVKVRGSYTNIRDFVESIQEYRRAMVVDSVVFTIQEEKGTRSLEASVTLTLPYFDHNTKTTSAEKK